MKHRYSAACGCDKGRLRGNNEDNFLFAGQFLPPDNVGTQGVLKAAGAAAERPCFAVFDGMGGAQFGEIASHTAARTMGALSECGTGEPLLFFQNCCERMNAAICEENSRLAWGHMGTTACALVLDENRAHVFNIGDSRVYILRGRELHKLSVDHVERLPEGSKGRKAFLTQNLGIDPGELRLEPHLCAIELCRGDLFLLCSDGLTDMLEEESMRSILRGSISVAAGVKRLIAEAMKRGGRDNITALLVKIK